MTVEKLKKLLPVMQALCEGKQIQFRCDGSDEWVDLSASGVSEVVWNWLPENYRIKPTPQEFWVISFNGGNALNVSPTLKWAEKLASDNNGRVIHVREVL